jgi:hypothetical protein
MKEEIRFLSFLGKSSARLSVEQAALILTLSPHHIAPLCCFVRMRHLNPFGKERFSSK